MSGRYAKVLGTHWRERSTEVSLAAHGLYFLGRSYCADNRTDGVIHEAWLAGICGGKVDRVALRALLEKGWWEPITGGYRDTRYLAENISKATAEARSSKTLERVNRHRGKDVTPPSGDDGGNRRRNSKRNNLSNASCNGVTDGVTQDTKTPRHQDTNSDLASLDSDRRKPVEALFEHWRSSMGKSQAARLDVKRRRRCEWAIAEYGLDAAKRAIDGCARSDWHMGRDPRSGGARYDDLTLIFRDSTHLERFRDMADAARGGRIEPLPNSAYRGTSQAEIDAIFGDVTDEELALVERGKVFYG